MIDKLFLNQGLIAQKFSDIEKSIALLNTLSNKTRKDFLTDEITASAAKYQLILAIEAAQSICNHLAARVVKQAPQSYADCFRILAENGIISNNLANKLASMAKFHNLLVHHYGKVDNSIVYNILENDLSDLKNYIEEIKLFVKSILKEDKQ